MEKTIFGPLAILWWGCALWAYTALSDPAQGVKLLKLFQDRGNTPVLDERL